MAIRVFSDEDLERLRSFPEINREELIRFFTLLARAERAGARIVKPAGPTFWGGYAGYFADPDGHLWEIAVNPDIPIDG